MIANIVILGVLIVVVVVSTRSSIQHFRGNGGCCGGSCEMKDRKHDSGLVLESYRVEIKGMHCKQCEIRLQNGLNQIEGVTAKVSARKKVATITLTKKVEEQIIIEAIKSMGYQVGVIRIG